MPAKKIKREKDKTTDNLKQKIHELEEGWKRALADYHNLEKRTNDQKASYARLANASLIDKLLSVLDDLERAQNHLQDHGILIILEQFREVLQSEGVKELEVQGKEFDPESMDCVEMIKGPANKVIEVRLKGYLLNDHIIRPAKVVVGKGR